MPTTEDLLEKNFLEIKNLKGNYPFAPIPCQIDEKISDQVKLFIQISPSERLIFYEKAEFISGFFLTFAERSATLAVREQSRQRVLEGLIALIIENCRAGDYRDTLGSLVPLYHAASKIGLDADALLKEVASSYTDNEAAKHMKTFPDRPIHDKSLEAFFYREVNAPDGFKYESIPWY